ncbi:MAG: histidine phosphatase family protein [Nitrosopumilus sp.]|nr:histidine phosphatase family protein [Nitrosopumilus sp.]MDH3501663.1 histidine phosphatase family protein [Nitrosopumilus sp.]
MGSIIFLRHGQAKNNTERILAGRTPGIPLTEKGIDQAKKAAEFIENMNISAIYSSPIERAKHTAEIVGTHNSIDVKIDERLIELDMGKFTGMQYDEIFSSHGNVFMKFYNGELEIAHNGVETYSEVKKRVLGIVDHVLDNHPDENVLLVTHMDPIKAMLSTVVDLTPENLFELIIANASLNIFREYKRKFLVSGLNVMHPSRFDQDW